ncbi:hypothetical protein D3C85_792360 [compost metagenome]
MLRRKAWAQGFADCFHGLGLDRQHDDISTFDGLGIVGEQFDAVLGRNFGALFGARVAGANLRCFQALGAQPANQAGGHVAGTDERNTSLAHERSL